MKGLPDFVGLSRCEAAMLIREVNKDFDELHNEAYNQGRRSGIEEATEKCMETAREYGLRLNITIDYVEEG